MLYLFFGGLAFVLSVASYIFLNLWMGINELIANVLSWTITVFFAFFTNRVWVFRTETSGMKEFVKQMGSFYVGRVVTLIVEELILLIFITWLGWSSVLIKISAQIIVIILNYFISKIWIFR